MLFSTWHIKMLHTVLLSKEPKAEGRRGGGGGIGTRITWPILELVVYCFHRCYKSQGSQIQGYKRQLLSSHFLMINSHKDRRVFVLRVLFIY